MANEHNFFQLALAAADEKIADIDKQHEALRADLTTLTSDRLILVGTRKALLVQLGQLAAENYSVPDSTSTPSKNHFKGLGQAAAARKHLSEIGHSQTHAELLDALLKGNFKTKSKRPSDGLRMAMQKRPDWFRWTKQPGERGRWELVEWPQAESTLLQTDSAKPVLALVQ